MLTSLLDTAIISFWLIKLFSNVIPGLYKNYSLITKPSYWLKAGGQS